MSVPTAEEFLKKYENDTDHYADQDYSEFRLIRALQEFAKLHVEKALKEASEQATIEDIGSPNCDGEWMSCNIIDKESIINSYPLDNVN
jgi:hypothetical protein